MPAPVIALLTSYCTQDSRPTGPVSPSAALVLAGRVFHVTPVDSDQPFAVAWTLGPSEVGFTA
jgi:hypothetical protein